MPFSVEEKREKVWGTKESLFISVLLAGKKGGGLSFPTGERRQMGKSEKKRGWQSFNPQKGEREKMLRLLVKISQGCQHRRERGGGPLGEGGGEGGPGMFFPLHQGGEKKKKKAHH